MSGVALKPRQCSEPNCTELASWGASKNPAWCQAHAIAKFREKGLEPLERVEKRTTFTLVKCVECGCETHCKLEYALNRPEPNEPVCRACYWKTWAAETSIYFSRTPVDVAQVKKLAEANNYEYLGPLTDPSLNNDPHHLKCNHCGRLSAERPGDIGWGCACQRRSRRTTPPASKSAPKEMLADCTNGVLDWWDHSRNDPTSLKTATTMATREAYWLCPECGHSFMAKVRDMTGIFRLCPVCDERRRAEISEELDRYRNMTVSQIPELLAAWADDADPTEAVVGSGPLRRFVCPAGHHPRLAPYRFLKSGCPHCRASETIAKTDEYFDGETNPYRLDPEMASQWHPTANGKRELRKVSPNSRRTFTWICNECGHTWEDSPKGRSYASALRCPQCRSVFDSLAYHHPDLAAEWADSNPKTAWQVRPSSAPFTPTWICSTDPSHVFEMSLSSRTKGGACPECSEAGKSRIELEHFRAAEAIFGKAKSGQKFKTGLGISQRTWRLDIAVELPDSTQLLIEYDGSYWHQGKAELDAVKTRALLQEGHRVVRLREHPLEPLPIDETDHYLELKVYSTAPDPQGCMEQIQSWVDDVAKTQSLEQFSG